MRALLLCILLALAACSKQESAPASPTQKSGAAPAKAGSDEVPVQNPDYVVDEPLPPFDEGPRPKLVAQSAVSSGGQMSLYEADDGSRLLRFEDLNVSGSGLEVLMVTATAPVAADLAGGLKVGALKGTRGNQNYLLSRTLKLAGLKTVVIASPSENLIAATAPLSPP